MQIAYAGEARTHPSGTISVTGVTDAGRTIQVFIHAESIEKLRKTFRFADKFGQSLGHSQWHIEENRPDLCESCDMEVK